MESKVKLTTDGEPENYPSWSPDGKRLLYRRERQGGRVGESSAPQNYAVEAVCATRYGTGARTEAR